ncbi:MAG TPA: beta-L-arabinofuranosidase domain-containing protein [Candidatus Acidoferrales bacterium]|nr:beta-L-arabinofuranosidase domain-containing protein [Candidatus Acidoferrales bacterium]
MAQPRHLSRRNFAAALAASTAAAPALLAQQNAQPQNPTPAAAPNPNTSVQQAQQQRQGTVPEVPPFQAPIEFARNPVADKVEPFPMTQVRLLAGPYKDAEEWNTGYMQRLPEERLVRNFLLNAGLPSSAPPFGGWEQDTPGRAGELRGHFTGHFLSASAQLWAGTGDKQAKAKGDAMVADLAKAQDKLGAGGYLSAFPIEWFDRLDARKNVWAPFYTIHKIMAGMFDMYQLAGNKQALQVLEGMSNWADTWSASKSEEHMQDILNTEYGGMNEVLYNLAAVTGEDRWAKAGDRFTKKRFFNPLASRRDELRGLHVNTHIPQVIGGARRYEISGDMRFHDVADYFWWEVTSARTYVTGGTSNGEGWLTQPRQLAAELKRSSATAECCCAYNMMKLTRHLYGWTADPRYFDYYERTMINHRLGTIYPKTGATQYYLSLTPGAWKTFNTDDKSFWCCTGTGVEEFSKLQDSIYWRDSEGLYVNQFIGSELDWAEKGFRLRQDTRFPEQQGTMLTVTAAKPVRMAMRLRVPSWLPSAPTVKVNGKVLDASASPGSYLTLSRVWKAGDKIEMALPMQLRIEAMPDDPTVQAVMYGPVVLAGDLGASGLTPESIVGPNAPRLQRMPIQVPVFKAAGADASSWIKPGDKALTFHTSGQPTDVTLTPLNSIFDRRYSVYWQVS